MKKLSVKEATEKLNKELTVKEARQILIDKGYLTEEQSKGLIKESLIQIMLFVVIPDDIKAERKAKLYASDYGINVLTPMQEKKKAETLECKKLGFAIKQLKRYETDFNVILPLPIKAEINKLEKDKTAYKKAEIDCKKTKKGNYTVQKLLQYFNRQIKEAKKPVTTQVKKVA